MLAVLGFGRKKIQTFRGAFVIKIHEQIIEEQRETRSRAKIIG